MIEIFIAAMRANCFLFCCDRKGWLLFNFPNEYDFQDFLISMFGLMFGMTGIGIAMQDMTGKRLNWTMISTVSRAIQPPSFLFPVPSSNTNHRFEKSIRGCRAHI
jgi:hypothetical protein